MRDRPGVAPECPEFPAPRALSASQLSIGDDTFAILEWPLDWQAPAGLTIAENEVLAGIVAGRSNREIARGRGTSVHTVTNQVARLFEKLGVRSRHELIVRTQRPHNARPKGEE